MHRACHQKSDHLFSRQLVFARIKKQKNTEKPRPICNHPGNFLPQRPTHPIKPQHSHPKIQLRDPSYRPISRDLINRSRTLKTAVAPKTKVQKAIPLYWITSTQLRDHSIMSIRGPNNGDQCLFVQSIRVYPSTLEVQKPRRLITLTMRSAFGLGRLQ